MDGGSVKARDAARSSLRVGYAQLLLSPTILACWAASFGANWALSLALSWQGAYLVKGLGLAVVHHGAGVDGHEAPALQRVQSQLCSVTGAYRLRKWRGGVFVRIVGVTPEMWQRSLDE